MDAEETPSVGAASSVTFGSKLLKAERRNLKLPLPTRWFVQKRIADFCSFFASNCGTLLGWFARPFVFAPRKAVRSCTRETSTCGEARATMSTSGTATPKAVPRAGSLLAKPTTSISGMSWLRLFWTALANFATALSPCALGEIWVSNSWISPSQSVALKQGLSMGCVLGCRKSSFTASLRSSTDCDAFLDSATPPGVSPARPPPLRGPAAEERCSGRFAQAAAGRSWCSRSQGWQAAGSLLKDRGS
mmetsp:Transcript_71102/g.179508  ORF Transcript_71102/g.179508 Transcript_71102/m.179508 type:complete len:247 (+) Transcript_71102:796-1536(+)